MDSKQVAELSSYYLFQNYGREAICFSHGQGEHLWDLEGQRYTDYVAGIAVNCLGHAHPELVRAISEQASRLIHVSNLYQIKEQADLGEAMASIVPSPLGRSMFCNSGAEANEAALKLAVKHTGRGKVVACRNSFHGRTSATLSVTGQEKYQKGFEPLLSKNVDFITFNSIEELKNKVNGNTAAVILEPVQGEGGVLPADREYFRTVRDLCTDSGALMIVDEVQTGMGRTGKWFGFQHFGVVPDIISLAKALGGGVPIGAIVTTPDIAKTFTPGTHGTTFGGNPLACAAANAVIRTMKRDKLVERAADLGERWRSELRNVTSGHPEVADVRGLGLMIGVEMGDLAKEFQRFALSKRLLVNVAGGKVLRLVPPLIISEASINDLNSALREFLK
ncbi:MAG TPA: acetylornithine transaminase [Methanomassiliicoccales archaeon]|nr:acetylornithine transaminase [Methanomassiliicoccales archaeon]HPR98283.1 acetylornithine transaminase [Methanomassiliicoccales archaeon]